VIADEAVPDTASKVAVKTPDGVLQSTHDVLADSDPEQIEARLKEKSTTLLGANASTGLWEDVSAIERQNGITALISRIAATPAPDRA